MKTTQDILGDLIGFQTLSVQPNIELIQYCAALLEDCGAEVQLITHEDGTRANLYATIGPRDRSGVLLSGHTDVVPIEGQNWTVPAFEMTQKDDRLYGRGTADMKGFVAACLFAAQKAARMDLETPLHLAFSYDEEIGCIGVRSLIDMLEQAPFRPQFCIVGEPTMLRVATGHKGKTAARVTCCGHAAHSALAPTALNAIHMACDMIGVLRTMQQDIKDSGFRDDDYDVPYTTLHVGKIQGGIALNIVPDRTEFLFEIRNLIQDDPEEILARFVQEKDAYLSEIKDRFPDADISYAITNTYPSLDTAPDAEITGFVQSLGATSGTIKVAFGTEGGLFSRQLGIPTVVCGPGSMDQGHKPDEYIEIAQLDACDAMLGTLLERLAQGL